MQPTKSVGLPWLETWRPRLLLLGLTGYVAAAAVGVTGQAQGSQETAGFVLLAAFTGCLAVIATWPGRLYRINGFWSLIATMAALVAGLTVFAASDALYLAAVIAVLVVGRLGRQGAVAVGGLAAVALGLPPLVPGWHDGPGWGPALATAFSGGVAYAFAEIVSVNRALQQAQDQIAALAVDGERNRIARDLHDLLGHSLTTITVKAALARRLIERDPSACQQEIAQVEDLSRQALADVRAAVGNYRDVTLATELARGAELLRASGIHADLPKVVELVDPRHDPIFGWVVREGVTNVVRHARATRCVVVLAGPSIQISDNGIGAAAAEGNGLCGLRERVTAVGGTLESGPATSHGWRLRVQLPSQAGRHQS